jgi:hypothetical protein
VFYTQASAIPEGEPIMMGMFPVTNHPAVLLFDSGASHTFINRTFVMKHDILIIGTQEDFFIQSPGGRLCTKKMVREVPIELGGHIFPTSMITLKNQDIDVILGMNWMYQRGAVIDALHRTIRFNLPDSKSHLLIQLPIPKRIVERVCATSVKEIYDIPVVCEFSDAFLDDLPGLSPDREVEFVIELKHGTAVTEPPNYDGPHVPVIVIMTSDSRTYVPHNLKGLLSSEQDPITGVLQYYNSLFKIFNRVK